MSVLDDPKYVMELRPQDVLFGRGSGPNDHEGNIRFRRLVAERKSEYMATSHRLTKATIAKEIVDQVFAANGRFMKKLEPSELKELGLPEASDVWEIVGDDTVMEKAKQALRQNSQRSKESSISPIRSTPRSVSPHNGISPATNRPPIGREAPGFHNSRQPSLSLDEIEPIPLATQRMGLQQAVQSRQHVGIGNSSAAPSWDAPRPQVPAFGATEERNLQSNVSQQLFETLPEYDDIPQGLMPRYNARGSITMHELSRFHDRRHVIDVQEMTDSFKSMKTSERSAVTAMFSSTDTMGTIEPINSGAGDMSIGTMESSMFSVFKGHDSVIDDAELDEKIAQIEAQVGNYRRRPGRPRSSFNSGGSLANMSFGSIGTDFGGFSSDLRRLSALSVGSNNSAVFSGKDLEIFSSSGGGYQPGTVPELGESAEDFEDFDLGSSSLSNLKSTLSIDASTGPSGVSLQIGNDNEGFASAQERYSGA